VTAMMMPRTFDDFFQTATRDAAHPDGHQPFDYQRRLACDPECKSRLIDIPTGLGKTAAVVLAWLWNRVINPSPNSPREQGRCPRQRGTHVQPLVRRSSQSEGGSTINQHRPRRLVYRLPMRALGASLFSRPTCIGPCKLAYYEMWGCAIDGQSSSKVAYGIPA
jgi:hypothetical protein